MGSLVRFRTANEARVRMPTPRPPPRPLALREGPPGVPLGVWGLAPASRSRLPGGLQPALSAAGVSAATRAFVVEEAGTGVDAQSHGGVLRVGEAIMRVAVAVLQTLVEAQPAVTDPAALVAGPRTVTLPQEAPDNRSGVAATDPLIDAEPIANKGSASDSDHHRAAAAMTSGSGARSQRHEHHGEHRQRRNASAEQSTSHDGSPPAQ